jgi:hypothetical protein
VRYAKLALGVLLAIAGVVATTGAIFLILWYAENCVGAAPGSLLSLVCRGSSVPRETAIWVIAALAFDAAAVVVIRRRGARWIPNPDPG